MLSRAYLEKGVKLEINHTSGLIMQILLLYNLVIDHSNVLIVRFTMLCRLLLQNSDYKNSAVRLGDFFFFIFLIGFTFDRPIIILETTRGYR